MQLYMVGNEMRKLEDHRAMAEAGRIARHEASPGQAPGGDAGVR